MPGQINAGVPCLGSGVPLVYLEDTLKLQTEVAT